MSSVFGLPVTPPNEDRLPRITRYGPRLIYSWSLTPSRKAEICETLDPHRDNLTPGIPNPCVFYSRRFSSAWIVPHRMLSHSRDHPLGRCNISYRGFRTNIIALQNYARFHVASHIHSFGESILCRRLFTAPKPSCRSCQHVFAEFPYSEICIPVIRLHPLYA
jgi:hypothetical protein